MKNKFSKKEIEDKIKQAFSLNPSKTQIRKIKSLAMSKNVKLNEYKNKFCKKCLSCFDSNNSKIRIRNRFKIIKCDCGNIQRYILRPRQDLNLRPRH